MGTASPQILAPACLLGFIEQVSALPDLQVILFGDQSDRKTKPLSRPNPEKAINTLGELSCAN
jgi:hypothetical protein